MTNIWQISIFQIFCNIQCPFKLYPRRWLFCGAPVPHGEMSEKPPEEVGVACSASFSHLGKAKGSSSTTEPMDLGGICSRQDGESEHEENIKKGKETNMFS